MTTTVEIFIMILTYFEVIGCENPKILKPETGLKDVLLREAFQLKNTYVFITNPQYSENSGNLYGINVYHEKKINKSKTFDRIRRDIKLSNLSDGYSKIGKKSQLSFSNLPIGDVMIVSDLNLQKEYFLFEFFSHIMGYLQLSSFPLDFVKKIMQRQMSHDIFIWEVFKYELPLGIWIAFWFLLTLTLIFGLLLYFCCTSRKEGRAGSLACSLESFGTERTDNVFTIVVHFLLFLLLGCVLVMLASNQKMSKSATLSPKAVELILRDVRTFVNNTEWQITSVVMSSVQKAMDSSHRDLEGVEELLGTSLKTALDAETNLKHTMSELNNLRAETQELTAKVSDLLKDCNEARNVGKGLERSLIELSRLLALTCQECLPRDRALCDTLQNSLLNVSFHVDKLLDDKDLRQLKVFEGDEDFDKALNSVSQTFQGLPRRVSLETAIPRAEIRSVLNKHRVEIYDEIRKFRDLSKVLTEHLSGTSETVHQIVKNITVNDFWRWIIVLVVCSLIFIVWTLLLCGIPCGCGLNPRLSSFLLAGLGLLSVSSVIIWAVGAAAFALGTHGQTLVCRQLYDEPNFTVLETLFDKDFEFFYEDYKTNVSYSLKNILTNCHHNRTAYTTFNLENVLKLDHLLNQSEWNDFHKFVDKFSVNLTTLNFLTPSLKDFLEQLSNISRVNMTKYRMESSKTVTNRDLILLAEQIQKVAKQLSDYRTVIKFEVLVNKTKNIDRTQVQLLKDYRDKILYKITAVELMMKSFGNRVHRSSSQMRRIQNFVKGEEWIKIGQNTTRVYTGRLENYFLDVHDFVKWTIDNDIGRCESLWNLFDATRIIICKMIVDPLNGFSFACFLCVLLFLGLTPLIIRILAQYKVIDEDSFSSITHRRARNGLLIDDEETWATPSPTSPSEEVARITCSENGPRQSPELLIIPPIAIPRPPEPIPSIRSPVSFPSTHAISKVLRAPKLLDPSKLIQLASRITESPRLIKSPIPSVLKPETSRGTRNRYESLKLIERSDLRTPRSWF